MAFIFVGSTWTPFLFTTKPKKITLSTQRVHFVTSRQDITNLNK